MVSNAFEQNGSLNSVTFPSSAHRNFQHWKDQDGGTYEEGDLFNNFALKYMSVANSGKKLQVITFDALESKMQGDPDFELTASSTSGLAISYTSSNPSVATIIGNKLR